MAPLNQFQVVTPRGTEMPAERCGHRIFADDNYVYLIGGYTPTIQEEEKRALSDTWRFNRLTHSWQQCTMAVADATFPLPDTLASLLESPFKVVSRGPDFTCGSNEAFIFGGTKRPLGEQSTTTNSFHWVCIDRAGRLQTVQVQGEQSLPVLRHQSMCRQLETNQAGRLCEVLYIVGDTTGDHDLLNLDVWKLQRPARAGLDQSWDATRLNRIDQFDRCCLELVAHDQKLYIFGSRFYSRLCISLDELTIFDLKSNQFEQLPTKADPVHGLPRERAYPALVHRRNMVYLLGGFYPFPEKTIFFMVWRLDLDSLQWTQLRTSLPVPVHLSSATISPDGCIFVFGGITATRLPWQPWDSLQRMWLLPPSLVHIAAGQLLKGMSERRLKELTEEGVRLADVPQLVSRILGPHPDEKNNNNPPPSPTHTLAAPAPGQATVEQKKPSSAPGKATVEQKKPSLFSTFLDWICCRPCRR